MTVCHLWLGRSRKMPKQTFYNLSEEKKQTLIKAATKEFSRVPLFEASIANIIKDARIPRGSFYQYFEDKEDVYFFLLDEYSKRYNARLISLLEKNQGDLIETFVEIYPILLKNFQDLELRKFYRNAFLNMNYKVENTLSQHVYEEKFRKNIDQLKDLINIQQLNIKEEKEVLHVIKIIRAVTIHNLKQVFVKDLPMDEAIKNYTFELNL